MARSYKSLRKNNVGLLQAGMAAGGMGGFGPSGLCKSQRPNGTHNGTHNGTQFFFMGYTPETHNSNSVEAERHGKACSTYARKIQPTEVAEVVRRYDWTIDTYYDRYKADIDLRDMKYYVKNSQDNVYVCLENANLGASAGVQSKYEPTGKSSVPFRTTDGYMWKYLYSIDRELKDFLKTVNSVDYMPIKVIDYRDARGSNVGSTNRAQYNVERQLGGKIVSATIDLSDTIRFATDSPSITVVGNGNKTATVSLSVNGTYVNGISVTDPGSGYDYATVRLNDTPLTHTASEVEAKIQINISPHNSRCTYVPANSYFYVEKVMYNVRIDTADLSSAVRQKVFNFYGVSKNYLLNKPNVDIFAGDELVLPGIKKNYRLSEKMLVMGTTAASVYPPGTFDYGTSTPTFNVGDGITDGKDINHQALISFFGRPNGYTGVNQAFIEITRETGIGGTGQWKNTNYFFKGFDVTGGTRYYNVQSSFATADIRRTSGEVLYINYLDSDLTMANELVSNFVFLQEV